MSSLKKMLFFVCVFTLFTNPFHAYAAYPERPVTLIIGFGAGGATDIMGRAFADLLSKELNGTIVVKNVVGAGGVMGAAELSNAQPDGYTLGYLPVGTMASQPNLRNLPYKWNAFTPLTLVSDNPVAVVTSKKTGWKTFQQAFEDIKKNPDKYFFVSSSPGSSPHISQQALFAALGVKVAHMPAKDSASAIHALSSNTTQFYADPPVIIRHFDLVGLGVFAEKRMASFPDLPTFKELGVDVPHFSSWHAFWGPANMSPAIVQTLDAAAKKVIQSEAFKSICTRTDMEPAYMGPADFAGYFAEQYALYGKYAAEFGLKK